MWIACLIVVGLREITVILLFSHVEWSGVEWSGVEWSGVEWSGVEWRGHEDSLSLLAMLLRLLGIMSSLCSLSLVSRST